jgi:hypothetical protein
MSITLTPEQIQLFLGANDPVVLSDTAGNPIGTAKKFAADQILSDAEIKKYLDIAKSPGPWYTYEEVKAKLEALEG